MMRIVTWNLNGIRAAHRKGLDDFINKIDSDVWLFQEVRALPEQMPKNWQPIGGHEIIWHPAEKKGYSGVSTWSRVGISEEGRGISTNVDINDSEGRVLHTKHGNLHCINIYENDIWNPSGNRNTSGFLIHEREWFSRFLSLGWHDLLRREVGDIKGPYSWWSNRGQARALNRGWRIDYALANEAALKIFRSAKVLREGGLVVSDHAPLIVDLDI